MFVDETSASTNMVRCIGLGERGKRVVARAPHGHWRTKTAVAAPRTTGSVAPFVLEGPITGAMFHAYVAQVLAPELRPDDVVVMNNLAAHKRARVQAAIRAAGAKPFSLPPYSPDLMPAAVLSDAYGFCCAG